MPKRNISNKHSWSNERNTDFTVSFTHLELDALAFVFESEANTEAADGDAVGVEGSESLRSTTGKKRKYNANSTTERKR